MFRVAVITSMLLVFSAHAQEVTRTSAPVPDRPSRRSASTLAGRPDAEVERVAPNRQALHTAHPPDAKRHLDKRFAAYRVGCSL